MPFYPLGKEPPEWLDPSHCMQHGWKNNWLVFSTVGPPYHYWNRMENTYIKIRDISRNPSILSTSLFSFLMYDWMLSPTIHVACFIWKQLKKKVTLKKIERFHKNPIKKYYFSGEHKFRKSLQSLYCQKWKQNNACLPIL